MFTKPIAIHVWVSPKVVPDGEEFRKSMTDGPARADSDSDIFLQHEGRTLGGQGVGRVLRARPSTYIA